MCLEVLSNVQTRGTNDNLSLNHPLLVILAPRHLVYVYGYPFPDGSIKGPKISVVSSPRPSSLTEGLLRCTRAANVREHVQRVTGPWRWRYVIMAAADQNHPLAIVADTSITAFTLWWFVF